MASSMDQKIPKHARQNQADIQSCCALDAFERENTRNIAAVSHLAYLQCPLYSIIFIPNSAPGVHEFETSSVGTICIQWPIRCKKNRIHMLALERSHANAQTPARQFRARPSSPYVYSACADSICELYLKVEHVFIPLIELAQPLLLNDELCRS